MKSKILNVDEIPEVEISTTDTVPVLANRKYLVNEKISAKNFVVALLTVKPKVPPHVPYHYHTRKETVQFVMEGRAKVIVEDEE